MEVSGTILRQVTCPSLSRRVILRGGVRVSVRPRTVTFGCSSGFSDEGHLKYYDEKKKKVTAVMSTKKKLKMLKGLYNGLPFSPELGFSLDPEKQQPLLDYDLQGKLTSDAAEVLMRRLEQVRAEEKELKRKKKQVKKAKKKASKMNTDHNCDESSSSSSSESSDSDCDNKVVDMNSLRVGAAVTPSTTVDELESQTLLPKTAPTIVENPLENAVELCSRNDTCVNSSIIVKNESAVAVTTTPQKRIEVCMGNKCKKLGSVALMQEFEKVVGAEGVAAVVGCKCMGKCKSAPNVRIQNNSFDGLAEGLNDSVKVPANPLLIGVGLEDVETIVARFLGEDENLQDMGLAASAAASAST